MRRPRSQHEATSQPGEPVNHAEFGSMRWWSGTQRHDLEAHSLKPNADGQWEPVTSPAGERHLGIEWNEPRDIARVVVRLVRGSSAPQVLQYWQHTWPQPHPDRRPGAQRGWIGRDDAWHGQWVTVRGAVTIKGDTWAFVCDPLDIVELPNRGMLEEAADFNVAFRRTLKLRLLFPGDAPVTIRKLEVFSGSRWQETEVEIHFGRGTHQRADWSGTIEAYNGVIIGRSSWALRTTGTPRAVRARILHSDCDGDHAERTVVTVRTKTRSFSFLIQDLDEPIWIKDYGVFIKRADQTLSFAQFRKRLSTRPTTIYDRVPLEPEQSYERARAEIPPLQKVKQNRWVCLGIEGNRQEWALRFNGELWADKQAMKLAGRETARLHWAGSEIHFRFGTGDPPDWREREDACVQSVRDGWMPIVTTTWLDRELRWEQAAFAALVEGDLSAIRGDEPIIGLLRFAVHNTTETAKRARLWIQLAPHEQVAVNGGHINAVGRVIPGPSVARTRVVQAYLEPRQRCFLDTGGRGQLFAEACPTEPDHVSGIETAVVYELDLAPGERHAITLKVPMVTFTDAAGKRAVADCDYDAKLAEVVAHWQKHLASGAQLETPDQAINDFFKAVPTHIAISVDRDVESGLDMVPAATYWYGVCANEACLQIRQLDLRGHHDRARAYLETFLQTQGRRALDGNFKSQDGVLQGLNFHGDEITSHFNYNLDHGFVLWTLCHHYRLTRDRRWLKRVAPNLLRACDFIIHERQATKRLDDSGRHVPEWGMLPAGHLEDNPEWQYWFAVNAHAHKGLQDTAEALAEIAHPEADRLRREANAYRRDLRAAVERAMVEAPVVRLLDGTAVPNVPTRAGLRGREWGWFRQTAYGPLHLVDGEVLNPNDEMVTWILQDLEDNLFPSRSWGRAVDLERFWFSQAGVTIQANLLNNAVAYLRRDQIEHAVRAFYNNFGAHFYPDVRCFTEHPVIELGHGAGPFYKTPDESGFLNWLRMLLVCEERDRLWLCAGVPRQWFAPGKRIAFRNAASFFGPLSFEITSQADHIEAIVIPPRRNPPSEFCLRLRHPERKHIKSVTINGKPHRDFDPRREFIRITKYEGRLVVRASY